MPRNKHIKPHGGEGLKNLTRQSVQQRSTRQKDGFFTSLRCVHRNDDKEKNVIARKSKGLTWQSVQHEALCAKQIASSLRFAAFIAMTFIKKSDVATTTSISVEMITCYSTKKRLLQWNSLL